MGVYPKVSILASRHKQNSRATAAVQHSSHCFQVRSSFFRRPGFESGPVTAFRQSQRPPFADTTPTLPLGNSPLRLLRPRTFRSDSLREHLRRHKIATLPELQSVLGTDLAVTVFGKLQPLHYLTSYSHRGRYYTLREIVRFDDQGLWSYAAVCFSRYGTLLATAEACVKQSPQGYFAQQLAQALQVEVQDAMPA